jgi:hypothetical protein
MTGRMNLMRCRAYVLARYKDADSSAPQLAPVLESVLFLCLPVSVDMALYKSPSLIMYSSASRGNNAMVVGA